MELSLTRAQVWKLSARRLWSRPRALPCMALQAAYCPRYLPIPALLRSLQAVDYSACPSLLPFSSFATSSTLEPRPFPYYRSSGIVTRSIVQVKNVHEVLHKGYIVANSSESYPITPSNNLLPTLRAFTGPPTASMTQIAYSAPPSSSYHVLLFVVRALLRHLRFGPCNMALLA